LGNKPCYFVTVSNIVNQMTFSWELRTHSARNCIQKNGKLCAKLSDRIIMLGELISIQIVYEINISCKTGLTRSREYIKTKPIYQIKTAKIPCPLNDVMNTIRTGIEATTTKNMSRHRFLSGLIILTADSGHSQFHSTVKIFNIRYVHKSIYSIHLTVIDINNSKVLRWLHICWFDNSLKYDTQIWRYLHNSKK